MFWFIVIFFVIMLWKYFSYDDDEEMKGFKAFWSTVAIMGFGIVGYFSIIVFFDGIREFWKQDGFVGAICFIFGGFIALFPGLCILMKAFENDKNNKKH